MQGVKICFLSSLCFALTDLRKDGEMGRDWEGEEGEGGGEEDNMHMVLYWPIKHWSGVTTVLSLFID